MTSPTATPPTATPPDQPSDPRRLVRLTDQGKIGGVAAGLGWYFGVDPTLFRVGFVVLALGTGGLAIGLYVLLMFVLPKATVARSGLAAPPASDGRSQGLTALAIIAAVLVIGQLDLFRLDVLAAAALIGIGVLLFNDGSGGFSTPGWLQARSEPRSTPPPPRPDAQPTAPAAGAAPPPPTPPEAQAQRGGAAPSSAYGAPYAARHVNPPAPQALPAPPKPRQRERSVLTALVIGVWLLTLGVAGLLARLDVVTLTVATGAALSLVVFGGGLLVGTIWGRARGLIPLGLVAAVVLAGATAWQAIDVADLGSGVGDRQYTPTVVQPSYDYRLFAGELRVDLTELELDGATVEVDAHTTLGELTVLVPEDTEVVVTTTVGLGDLTVFGERRDGQNLDYTTTLDGPEGAGRLVINASANVGDVTVQQR